MVLLVYIKARHLCRTQRALDKQLGVSGIVYDVNVLIAEFTNDAANTTSIYTHTSTNWVDALVITLNCNLCSLTRHASHTLNGYEAISNLWHLSLKQTLKEHRTCTTQNNLRIVVLVVNAKDNGTQGLALAILVFLYLLTLRQNQFVVLVINEQHLALPHLINLGADNLTHAILILIVERVVLQLKNLRCKSLAQVKYCTATELGEVNTL